jgi:ABC-2 type transport system permease protein
MSKLFQIIRHEYARHVFRKRFFIALLSIPLLFGFIIAVSIFSTVLSLNRSPLGYIDLSGFLSNPVFPPETNDFLSDQVEILAFSDEDNAKSALENKEIQAYYVLASDYLDSGSVNLVYLKEPDSSVKSQFENFLRANLVANLPAKISNRIISGNEYTIQSIDASLSMVSSNWYNLLVPIFAGILFIMVILTSGGYLLRAVVEEKENRTIEIIVTSVSPGQLMTGKMIGNIAIGFTQIIFWGLFIALLLVIGRNNFEWVKNLQINGNFVLLMIVVLLPSFIMIAALMSAVGATVTETSEAQQIAGLFSLPITIPYMLTSQIISNPNSPLTLFLSFFPLTAPVTLTLRSAFTQIPIWQEILNIAILVLCAAGAVWLAARTFRMGMLRYGKKLTLREIFGREG